VVRKSDDIARNFKRLQTKVRRQVESAINKWEEGVKTDSQELTPKDTGGLRDSYLAEVTNDSKTEYTLTIKYGNGLIGEDGENYAAIVHEWPSSYNFTTEGTGPRFLEIALNQNKERLLSMVAKASKL